MRGVTLIHLSDLHIENPETASGGPERWQKLAEQTAERIAVDCGKIADEHKVSFRSDETFLIVTGDITNSGNWREYEIALLFVREFRSHLKSVHGCDLRSDHVICIPGNHDIEIPPSKSCLTSEEWKLLPVLKYRNFKLFLDQVTDHATHAKAFALRNPIIYVRSLTSFAVNFLDLNSCMRILTYENPPSATQLSMTSEWLDGLARVIGHDPGMRIALMHHELAAFPGEEGPGRLSQGSIKNWLVDHSFRLLLCGHVHRAFDDIRGSLHIASDLSVLGTGHSFLKDASRRSNCYQVLRIEPDRHKNLSLYRREYLRRDHCDAIHQENLWIPDPSEAHRTASIPDLRTLVAGTGYREFLGTRDSEEWVVIAHCRSRKFTDWGIASPGEQVHKNLLEMTGKSSARLVRVSPGSKFQPSRCVGRTAVFLVDSPHYNPYTNWVLRHYAAHLAGGRVRFVDEPSGDVVKQRIEIPPREIYASNKAPGMKLFDTFKDYLLVMRLPCFVPSVGSTKVEVVDVSTDGVIWVVAGIHSKASYAGAMIFTPANLQKVVASLEDCGPSGPPEYFEAVYEAPEHPELVQDFSALKRVYLGTLRLKRDVAMADDLPWGVTARFLKRTSHEPIPIEIVHLDPVAACNCSCEACIEKEMRKKNSFLSLATCSRILLQLVDIGCKRVNFYGGEPTLHPEFPQLLGVASKLGFEGLLVTNGTMLMENAVRKPIVEAGGRFQVRVSIDGDSTDVHASHHGIDPGKGFFEKVRQGATDIIAEGVPLTVSFLLYRDSVRELSSACEFWRSRGAKAIVLRPVTNIGGVSPILKYSENERQDIMRVLKDHQGFALTPTWFRRWLFEKQVVAATSKPYDECFSASYRIAVSPLEGKEGNRTHHVDGVALTETDDAWLSLCTYRRYDPSFGCLCPLDLAEWMRNDRQTALDRIVPSKACNSVICCRHEYNMQIAGFLKTRP